MRSDTAFMRAPGPLTTLERVLAWLLRFAGVVEMLAIVAVFMPFHLSASAHEAMGLGKLPDAPIVIYFIRSTSLLYVFHGAILFYLARDVRRYSRLIIFLGAATMIGGIVILFIDSQAGLPKWWMLGEPFGWWGQAAAVLLLQARIRKLRARAAAVM